jgi:hypothetical protein
MFEVLAGIGVGVVIGGGIVGYQWFKREIGTVIALRSTLELREQMATIGGKYIDTGEPVSVYDALLRKAYSGVSTGYQYQSTPATNGI